MEISIKELFDIMIKKIWVIIVCVVVFTIGFGAYAKYQITPMYDSDSSFIIIYTTATVSESTSGDISTTYNQNVVSDSSVLSNSIAILNTKDFYEVASDYFTYSYISSDTIKEAVTFTQSSSTSMLTLKVSYDDPYIAYELAKCISELIEPYLLENYPQPGSNVIGINKIESEQVPIAPSSPNIPMYLIIGFLAGGVLGVLIVLIMKFADTRIHKDSDLAQYKLPMLGVIPEFREEEVA